MTLGGSKNEPRAGRKDEESFLSGYPGPAVLIRAGGSVLAANGQGAGLGTLIEREVVPEIAELMENAFAKDAIASGSITLSGARGEAVFEITVVPQDGGKTVLVLARDLTMERNLRSALVESRQRFKDLVEASSDFAWEVGVDSTFVFVSSRGAIGYKAEELVGKKPEAFVINPEEYAPLPFLSDRPLDDIEMWLRQADGSTACVLVSCLPLLSEDGTWQGARGICRDVTEEREREAALTRARNREQLLNYIVSTIRDEVEPYNMLTAAAAATARALGAAGCRIYRQNDSNGIEVAAEYGDKTGVEGLFGMLSGFSAAEEGGGKGSPVEEIIGPWRVLAAATHYRQSVNGVVCMWKKDDGKKWDDDSHILIGDVANQLGIANEQIANHERIVRLSRTDAMTGLLNRRAFLEEELPRHLARLERNGQGAALFYVDMDNFKRVNDVHGHQRGDDAILFLRDMLMEFSRPGDVIARLGGDEFAMWLDGMSPEVSENRARTLIEASSRLQAFSGDEEHPLGLSVGVALYHPIQGETLKDLVARADQAMYRVKRAGKGGYGIAPPPGASL